MKNNTSPINYRLWIKQRLDHYQSQNPQYSLRSYAKSLSISPATLSQVINGKRELTLNVALRIADFENLDPNERLTFLKPFINARSNSETEVEETSVAQNELDEYQLKSNWYHYAILSIGKLNENSHQPNWIAKRLGITIRQAKSAIARLERLGLIEKTDLGFKTISHPHNNTVDAEDPEKKRAHRQILSKIQESIDSDQKELKDINHMAIAINRSGIPKIKQKLQSFMSELYEQYDGKQANEVYSCNVYFFPLTKI